MGTATLGCATPMKKRWILFVCLTLYPTLRAAGSVRPEPSYRGKTFTLWLHALSEPNPEIRIRAAGAIAQMGFPARSAAPVLAELLIDPNNNVRIEAAPR